VLGIREILVRIGIRTSDDPTPDSIPFFSEFKDAKKFLFIFFSYNLPPDTLSSVLKT
jgi:hypothetical protein